MRILSRQAFLALPANTVYSSYSSTGAVGPLMVKERTITDWLDDPIDFFYQPLTDTVKPRDGDIDSVDAWLRLEAGDSVPADLETGCRDGSFDDSDRFLVWDQSDLFALVHRLQSCLPTTLIIPHIS